jgi:hypothetical protein
MVQALWESLFAVGVIVALLVLFRERLNVQGWAGRSCPSRLMPSTSFTRW